MNTTKMRHQLARTGLGASVPVQHLGTPMWALLDHPHLIGDPFLVSFELDHRGGVLVNSKPVQMSFTGNSANIRVVDCPLWDDAESTWESRMAERTRRPDLRYTAPVVGLRDREPDPEPPRLPPELTDTVYPLVEPIDPYSASDS